VFAYPGEWTVAVRRSDEPVVRTFSLSEGGPGDLLVDVAGDGSVSIAHRPDGFDGSDPEACETNGRPYESSDPDENLDHPVDLWVLDRSDGAHHLAVSIGDGGTEVFSDTFDTREGYDKANRPGLLAKKATYDVAVTLDDEPTMTASVTVEEGVQKLVVRVTEAGKVDVVAD
jgi:hypothetical protein